MPNAELNNLSKFLLSLPQLFEEAIGNDPKLRSLIEKANKDQLREGLTATNGPLPDYSETSVKVFGKPEGRIKLYDTGEFYKSITAKKEKNSIKIVSDEGKDWKFPMLALRYGTDIIGISIENLSLIEKEYIEKKINEIIKKIKL
jgi:hypothetical protein